jgi:hypothetical protein
MPEIYAYRCNICNFYFPCGWGGYMYVTDEKGKRIACYHPGELSTAYQVLGMDVSDEIFKARTGFNSYCVCLDCLKQFELDIRRDERRCSVCDSLNVKTAHEMIGETCPRCGKGTVMEIDTGLIS